MKFKKEYTTRGFEILSFNDRYDNSCSIQESSLATEECIWLGINDAKPRVMAKVANEKGYPNPNNETVGWIDYYIPPEVLIPTRMHLTRQQANELAKVLLNFSKTGNLEVKE